MVQVVRIAATRWDQPFNADESEQALRALERGAILLLPELRFSLFEAELALLEARGGKTDVPVVFDPATDRLRGCEGEQRAPMASLMRSYADCSAELLVRLLPRYAGALLRTETVFRPQEVAPPGALDAGEAHLHVDTSATSPTGGRRILGVFSNLNPDGRSRRWRVGDSFDVVARRYAGSIRAPLWGSAMLLRLVGRTLRRRSLYDHYMLRLHERMKADAGYQRYCNQDVVEFPAGSTWIAFTDLVPHAEMAGRLLLEQAFQLPVEAMADPARAPLTVLERHLGRSLVRRAA